LDNTKQGVNMKKIVALSLVAATMAFGSTADEIADLQKVIKTKDWKQFDA